MADKKFMEALSKKYCESDIFPTIDEATKKKYERMSEEDYNKYRFGDWSINPDIEVIDGHTCINIPENERKKAQERLKNGEDPELKGFGFKIEIDQDSMEQVSVKDVGNLLFGGSRAGGKTNAIIKDTIKHMSPYFIACSPLLQDILEAQMKEEKEKAMQEIRERQVIEDVSRCGASVEDIQRFLASQTTMSTGGFDAEHIRLKWQPKRNKDAPTDKDNIIMQRRMKSFRPGRIF